MRRKNKPTERRHNPMVYAHIQWTDNRGYTAERMPKALLEQYVAEGLIYADYEIIAYI